MTPLYINNGPFQKLMHLIRRKNPLSEYRVKQIECRKNEETLSAIVSTKNSFGSRSGLTFLVNSLDQDRAQQSHPVNLFGILGSYLFLHIWENI